MNAPLAFWILAAVLLWRWWTRTGRPMSPDRIAAAQEPNATRNSEDLRDIAQAQNNGQAFALPQLRGPLPPP